MKEYSFSDLRTKRVINIIDGRELGHLCDIVFTCTGRVMYFVAPGRKSLFKSNAENIYISWRNILKVGEDVILVELSQSNPVMCQSNEELPPEL